MATITQLPIKEVTLEELKILVNRERIAFVDNDSGNIYKIVLKDGE